MHRYRRAEAKGCDDDRTPSESLNCRRARWNTEGGSIPHKPPHGPVTKPAAHRVHPQGSSQIGPAHTYRPRASSTTRGPCPGLDIGPGPDVAEGEPCDGLGEVRVPTTPVVDNAGALGAEASCDLAGADEVVCIHHASHDPPG